MTIVLKRAYEDADKADGYRVLVDRLWPRGVSKDSAALDDWIKDVAPTDAQRKGLHSGDMPWQRFYDAYITRLQESRDTLQPLADKAARQTVTLVFAAKDVEHNNAVVLRDFLQSLA